MAKEKNKPAFTAHIPQSVLDQEAAADAAIKQEPIKDTPEPEGTPAAEDAVIIDNPSDDDPPKPVKSEDKPAEPVNQDDDDGDVDWQHKYKVLVGIHQKDAQERDSLKQVVDNLSKTVEQQNAIITQLQSNAGQKSHPAKQSDQKPAEHKPLKIDLQGINTDDLAGYGDEIVALGQSFNELLAVNKQLVNALNEGQVGGDSGKVEALEKKVELSAKAQFSRDMSERVPNWSEIIKSSDFQSFLNQVDEISMYRYGEIYNYALDSMNADQLVNILKRYAEGRNVDLGVAAPETPAQETPETVEDPLAGLAMPNQDVTDQDKGTPRVNYPTREEFKKAAQDMAAGRITADQYNDITHRFQQGIAAGKVK